MRIKSTFLKDASLKTKMITALICLFNNWIDDEDLKTLTERDRKSLSQEMSYALIEDKNIEVAGKFSGTIVGYVQSQKKYREVINHLLQL